jgi:putative hydrolase of the HAD superfamily
MDNENKNLEVYDNIIFDLGGVILNLDYNRTIEEFKKYLPDLDESVFFGKENQLSFFSDYEIGRIRTNEFKELFDNNYKIKLSDLEFENCWNAMIYDFPIDRIRLINHLRNIGKNIFLLSNINELHELAVEHSFSKLKLDMNFRDLFSKIYYSHKIGMRKPNIEIFDFVVSESDLQRDKTLFIDDSHHHVLGARKAGIDAIHLFKPLVIEQLDIFKF